MYAACLPIQLVTSVSSASVNMYSPGDNKSPASKQLAKTTIFSYVYYFM